MKAFLLTTFLLLFFNYKAICQGGEEPCKLILQNGLYKTFQINRTSNFTQDFKSYLSSNTFKSDLKSSKWSGSLNVVIDGVPLGIDAGASDSEITNFQQKVANSTSLQVKQNFYDYALTSIPDVELAREYTNCIQSTRQFGFKLFPSVSDREAIFVINYTNQFTANPLPKVTNFIFSGGSNIQGAYKVGETVANNRTILADRDPNKELILILETNQGVVSYRVPAEPVGYNRDFPIGTVITSYLNWEQFQASTQNNFNNTNGNIWTSRYSKWAPADGREIPNSTFQQITSQNNLPDLRGVFIRGLNQFDYGVPPISGRDPDTRQVGGFQGDSYRSHDHGDGSHSHSTGIFQGAATNFSGPVFRTVDAPQNDPRTVLSPASGRIIQFTGGPETRPINMAMYYYIRIN